MKILIVGFTHSVHVARFVNMINDGEYCVKIFPSKYCGLIHREMPVVDVYGLNIVQPKYRFVSRLWRSFHKLWKYCTRFDLEKALIQEIEKFEPDLIHALEFQSAGYLVENVKSKFAGDFPIILLSNWGSDIYHFRQFENHLVKIRKLLSISDYYSCECLRDVCLAEYYGFSGKSFPPFPNAGGILLKTFGNESFIQTSRRKIIMVKGYEHWVGRALVAIKALSLCEDMLSDYVVILHSASKKVKLNIKDIFKHKNIKYRILPPNVPHDQMLNLYSMSRIAVGLSLSDGASTSFLEAISMGAFPVQSWTACADEWIEDGVSGFLVPPEDVESVATALRRALTDDALVDAAAKINRRTAIDRLDAGVVRERALDMYRTIAQERGVNPW